MQEQATTGFWLSPQQEFAVKSQPSVGEGAVCLVSLEGPVSMDRLQNSLREMVARHEILRTVFRRQPGLKVPFQVVLETAEVAWQQIDLGLLDQSEYDSQVGRLFQAERARSRRLEDGPVLWAQLVTRDAGRSALILSLPALSADAQSFKMLVREIALIYAGQQDQLPEPFRYVQFSQWQADLLQSEEEDAQQGRAFWKRRLEEPLVCPSLPGEDKPEQASSLSEPVTVRLEKQLANVILQSPDSSLILLSAWQTLVSRVSGQNSFRLGVYADSREYEELENAIGCFARILPIPTRIENNFRFSHVLRQTKDAIREAVAVQEYFAPEAIGTDGDLISFAYHDLGSKQEFGGLRFELERVVVVSERFKLRLNAVRLESRLELEFHYDASRFERAAVEHMAGYYQNLLAAAVANPETAVSRLPLLSGKERRQLLVEWNQTAAAYPEKQTLQELFEQQAARVPEREAVRCGEQAFSYRELNERANQLAHYLRRQGVGPDRPVGLCLERSAETLVAVLAILKAGGAYVPLNPDNPPARLLQQLQGAAAVITEAKLVGQLPAAVGQEGPSHTIVLDRDQKLWAKEAKTNPESNTTPENLVYVIYTSGSTGVPKGVAVRHRNLVNYADFITKRLELDRYPEGLQFATVSTLGADLGNTCIYPGLISGGTVHIVGYEMATDPRRFAEYVKKHPIDVLKIVPSHLQALVSSEDAAKLLPRKYLIFGGETLTSKLVEKIAALNPSCEILNHYGPTETTVGSLTLKLKDYDWKQAKLASIPIGRPIQNTQLYILDANLEPVPLGVIGELYIAGAGVTAGYLGQAEKTAERFIQNPFATNAGTEVGSTLYRTGDLARYGADGNVEFLGRGDDQVKVRGFRIELGEIEAVLARHPGVKQVVVLARGGELEKDAQGEKRLLAYVVPSRETSSPGGAAVAGAVTGEDLRAYLKQHVPDYMVPQAVMVLGKLPLNANGKIDRQALPEPEQAQTARAYVAPRTATEEAVAAIWAEVLRREANQISIYDNFFDLGGHSLLATQVISRVRKALNIELPLRTLFESPTVAALAGQAEKAGAAGQPEIPAIVRVPRDQPLPLSFAQQRLWVLDQIEPNNPLYNIPRSTRLKGKLNRRALIDTLNEIVRRHESQRTTFAKGADGRPVQVVAESLTLQVPVIDLSGRPGAERETEALRIASEEERTPFDLSKGPLLRARIVKLDAEDHVLLVTMHHIVSDAWSAAIFLQEMNALYSAFTAGKPSPLPELAVQYGDYAAWQRKFLQGPALDAQLNYWREHLKGAPPLLQLPSDRPRPSVRKFEGTYEPVALAKDVADAIKAFSQQEGATPFMTLLAAFNALLARYSGQEHIVLGTDIANRTTAETERMIGFFINLLPVHTDLSGDPSFHELVSRVREVALGAYAHQDIPFDKLVEDLQPERNRSHNPIVQALFVMQNTPRQQRELPGLELSPFPVPLTRSKFDLAVFISDNGAEVMENWVYSTELFERDTILRMASHFENLLRRAVSMPDTRLSGLDLLSEREKKQREAEKAERKQSQRKKLMAVEPKAVNLAAEPSGKNS